MTSSTNNDKGPCAWGTPYENRHECYLETKECDSLRFNPNWIVSSHQYNYRMSESMKRCFNRTTFLMRPKVEACWDYCNKYPETKNQMSCWWSVKHRECIVIARPESAHGFFCTQYRFSVT